MERPFSVWVGTDKPRTFKNIEAAYGYALAETIRHTPGTHTVIRHRRLGNIALMDRLERREVRVRITASAGYIRSGERIGIGPAR